MSNKNTPIRGRFSKIARSACTPTARSTTTPTSSIGKKATVAECTAEIPSGSRNRGIKARFKHMPTEVNACYTPSSLYRNVMRNVTNSGTPQNKVKTIMQSAGTSEDRNTENSNLIVAVRVRPLNTQECTRSCVKNIIRVDGNELTILAGTTADSAAGVSYSFTYDNVFYSCDPSNKRYACQQSVFDDTARPLIDRAFEGYNACLFAYGQTGSGKSYSMMGIEALDDQALDGKAPHPEAGIIPRFCYELFRRIEAVKDHFQVEIEVSYFEIYNEKIHDLLCVEQAAENRGSGAGTPMQQRLALKVREHPIWGPYVVDLNVHPVDSYESLRNWLAVGNSQRATAATGMNNKSSRSHSIFNIMLNLTEISDSTSNSSTSSCYNDLDANGTNSRQTRRSKISLVDLAGSERISATDSNCERIREGVSINKSLLTLGKVIAALSEAKKSTVTNTNFVPYRESVLTWLLRENLGGNSKTVMLATISPASLHIEETLATLRYACQARTIVNRVRVNESPHDKIIRELRAEVDRLKSLRNEYERNERLSLNSNSLPRKIIIETSVDESEVEALRQQLAERERELQHAQKSWMERLKEAEDQRKCEMRLLKRKGLALELSADQKQACLVNLTADPILSGTLFYILPPGAVKIGRTRTSTYCSQPDIVLDGPLVGYHHCVITNECGGQLFITSENTDFETYLNGELVTARQQMYHGDRLVIGGSHYFRISNPFCIKCDKAKLVDFQLAHKEILHKQEEKLRRELEEEKHAALHRIELERVKNERSFRDRLQKLELEQLKMKCNSEILETERKALEQESAIKNHCETSEALAYTPSFKSTLLEDINRIMQNPSEKSLHQIQLMVKEATQHCRNLDLNVEFHQSQVLDEFGMFRTVVMLINKSANEKAEWPTARLGVWLDLVRNTDNIHAGNIFDMVDIEWFPMDSNELNETLNDTLNSSRISLNLSIVKEAMLKQQQPAKNSVVKSTPNSSSNRKGKQTPYLSTLAMHNSIKKMLTYDDCTPTSTQKENSNPHQKFTSLAVKYVQDMQRAAAGLKNLCETAKRPNRINISTGLDMKKTVTESVAQIENILLDMQTLLVESTTEGSSTSKTPKSVRFLTD